MMMDITEAIATLPEATVDALYQSWQLALKLLVELGGAEADLLTQLEILETVTLIDASAGWCLMIGAASLGRVGAFLSDEAIERMFVGGRPARRCLWMRVTRSVAGGPSPVVSRMTSPICAVAYR